MNDKEWREGLKLGDEVLIDNSRYGFDEYFSATVEKVTKTQIITNYYEMKFNKKTGYSIPYDVWHCREIVQKTEERMQKVRIQKLSDKAKDLRHKLSIPQAEEELIRFIEALKPFVELESKD